MSRWRTILVGAAVTAAAGILGPTQALALSPPPMTGVQATAGTVWGSGHRYYLNSQTGNDAASGTSPGQAWKTLAPLQAAQLRPGDTVAFARGSTFTGSATIASSGTAARPIRLTAYGTGAAPVLTNPGGWNMLYLTGSHIDVSDLEFTNGVTFNNDDGTGITGPKYEQSGAVAIATGANDITVEDNLFEAVGVGVKTYGLRTSIQHNTFENLTIAFDGIDSGSETSYGAIGVSLNNSDENVGWNQFINCRSTDSPYGADGGAIEIEGFEHPKNDIWIHDNFSSGSQGFLEVTETSSSHVLIDYNVSDDYQQFVAFDTTDDPSDYQVLHNTVLRRSPLNTTTFFATLYYREVVAQPAADWLTISDNIFDADAEKVLNGSYTYEPFDFEHDHNVYTGQPYPVGYPLGTGDMVANPQFTVGPPPTGFLTDPSQVALQADSPAIGIGRTRPAAVDILGHPIPLWRPTDAGAVAFIGNPKPPAQQQPPTLGAELLGDPGFESQTGGAVAAPWYGYGAGSTPVVAVTGASDAHGGSAYAELDGNASDFTDLRQYLNVTPGQEYQLSLWVRASSGICNTCIYYGVKDYSGNVVREFIATDDPGWRHYVMYFTPTTDQVFVHLGFFGAAGQTLDTDDWSLQTLSQP